MGLRVSLMREMEKKTQSQGEYAPSIVTGVE